MTDKSNASPPARPALPPGFKIVYDGVPLPPFYAAEMLRPLIGKTVFARDSGGRTRTGELKAVPNVREDAAGDVPPVEFVDERALFLRQIVCIAVFEPPK